MRDFTISSSELAAERFRREMLSTTSSITSKRELLNSYYTLFPLKLKELEALVSVFSFCTWDCVAASFSSKARLNAVNFRSNLVSTSCENNSKVLMLDNEWPDDPQAVARERSQIWKDSAIEAGTLARSVSDSIANKVKVERDAFEWLIIPASMPKVLLQLTRL